MGPSAARSLLAAAVTIAVMMVLAGTVLAQTMYKYRGDDGEWIFTDRKPPEETQTETRALSASFVRPTFDVAHQVIGQAVEFTADNRFHAPIEVNLVIREIAGIDYPHPDNPLRWVVPPRSQLTLLSLPLAQSAEAPFIDYMFQYLPGDPSARHSADVAYLAPFSAGANYPITQAYPDSITHTTRDSMHAVDLAMPIGTDILAARGGIVFDVAANNFQGGLDAEKNGKQANIVRILHDDGTFSVYAHLNWNSIRVKPGDRVRAGEYIADSGNTGFSSGPHLHFAVQRNVGMQIETVPVTFRGPNSSSVVPKSGEHLSGYR